MLHSQPHASRRAHSRMHCTAQGKPPSTPPSRIVNCAASSSAACLPTCTHMSDIFAPPTTGRPVWLRWWADAARADSRPRAAATPVTGATAAALRGRQLWQLGRPAGDADKWLRRAATGYARTGQRAVLQGVHFSTPRPLPRRREGICWAVPSVTARLGPASEQNICHTSHQ